MQKVRKKRFIKIYPNNEDLVYAYFLIATCYYELIVDEKKDTSALLNSKKYFKIVIEEYPNTDFASDAKFKTFGCGSAIASSSLVTEWVKGKKIDEANSIKNTEIATHLALPPVKIHCSVLAEDAIKAEAKTIPFSLKIKLFDIADKY